MKKVDIVNLIKYHVINDENSFINQANEIAKYFDDHGDNEIASYIMGLISRSNVFTPQSLKSELTSDFFEKVDLHKFEPLPIPEAIQKEIDGLINAYKKGFDLNKFLFKGPPGTGKTESVKSLARLLKKELYKVNLSSIVDSMLGRTAKNIKELFDEINAFPNPENVLILLDEIDAITMDRINNNDSREMGRATSTILTCLDNLNKSILLIATTNLHQYFDDALLRRFDYAIDFSHYEKEDIQDIGWIILEYYSQRMENINKNKNLFKKIIKNAKVMPYPGKLKNLIKSSLAFSDPNDPNEYLKRLYYDLVDNHLDINILKEQGFTVREIETLTDISKSKIAKDLKENKDYE